MRSTTLENRRNEAGAALVELAALSTILLAVLAASIDFGNYFYDGIVLGNAAQAGVQYGAHDSVTANDLAGMRAAATADAAGLTLGTPTATNFCTCSDGTTAGTTVTCSTTPTCTTGKHQLFFVQVTTTGTFNALFSYPGVPASESLSRTATMQVSP